MPSQHAGHRKRQAHAWKPEWMIVVHAKQRYTRAVRVNHDAHDSKLTSCVYILSVIFYVIDMLCTRKPCHEHFQKFIELYS